ncbi:MULTISPECIES: AI-2E family transporter [unclassified Cryobacterium]|uniref:AI-2E family transporter n=1 Tax=unclassified Cryobacterium TaxID=2649013 RepID=UPI00144513FD
MIFGKRSRPARPQVPLSRRRIVEDAVPVGVQIAGAWSWRILLMAGVAALLVFLVIQLRVIVVPLMIAVLVSSLLVPFAGWLQRQGWPKWLAVMTAALTAVGVITALIFLIVTQIRAGWPDLQAQSLVAWERLKDVLLESPLHITEEQLSEFGEGFVDTIQRDASVWVSGVLSVGSTAGHLVAGLLITLFASLLILIDGRNIWHWVVRLFPRRARLAVDGAGAVGWVTLSNFARVQIFVAAIDAIGIGLGAFFLGLPLAVPIAIAVFLGSFIPIVGAVVTGALAVFIALVYKDIVIALIMLAIVIAVQQLESHVLQPLIMGNAVKVHPLGVVLAVAAGSYVAGIPGALFAVPIVATANAMILYVASGRWRTDNNPQLEDIPR